jgi:hypothetical protein
MPLPIPPYTYDDPRIAYDEVCFFYDGDGYDAVCLAGPAIVALPGGASTSSSATRRSKGNAPLLPFINIFIQAEVVEVNDDVLLEEEATNYVRFSGENTPIAIQVNNIKMEMDRPYITGQLIKAVAGSEDFNEEMPIGKVELQPVEEYQDIKVEAELVKEEEVRQTVTADIIKGKP